MRLKVLLIGIGYNYYSTLNFKLMIYLIYCLYAHFHGITNAFLYSRKGAESLPENEHNWLVGERAAAASLAIAGFIYGVWLWPISPGLAIGNLVLELISLVAAFSFWHNRSYYITRDKIDATKYGPRHQSPTSTAKLEFSYKKRRNYFIVSLIIIVINFIFVTVSIF